jgi:hypothetical protein
MINPHRQGMGRPEGAEQESAFGGLQSVDAGVPGSQALAAVARRLAAAGIAVVEVGMRLASLDEVFLALTGDPLAEAQVQSSEHDPDGAPQYYARLARPLKLRHSPDQLLDVLLMPITFVLVFVFLFGKAVAGDWQAYLQFVLPGIAVQALMFVSLGTALALNTDLRTGIFDRFRSLPIARSAPLAGSLLSDLVNTRSPLYWCSALVLCSASGPMAARLPCWPDAD